MVAASFMFFLAKRNSIKRYNGQQEISPFDSLQGICYSTQIYGIDRPSNPIASSVTIRVPQSIQPLPLTLL
jgi:hypothetical protein